jgi:predicted O-linked N-acetylglucosamine transferase (SPINDLY family)
VGAAPSPSSPAATAEQAFALMAQRQHAEAESLLRKALFKNAGDPELNAAMGFALGYQGRVDESEPYIKRAAMMRPRHIPYQQTLADLHLLKGHTNEGDKAYRAVIALSGNDPERWRQFAFALADLGLFERSSAAAKEGLALHPGHPGLAAQAAISLMQCARSDEAVAILKDSAARHPDNLPVAQLLASGLNYSALTTPREVFEAHQRFGRLLTASITERYEHQRPNPADAERRLRIGFVSADLRRHACSFFFEPLISSLDRAALDTFCYHVGRKEDDRTAQLRAHAHQWRHCPDDSPAALSARIKADAIDILIDLSGLTEGNRLEVLARRPAPVQMTYLGYPHTTGLPAIDYRIVDTHTDPPGNERFAVENLIRIDPCFLCFAGMDEAAIAPPPCSLSPDTPVTFGSFNALLKMNDPLIELWSGVLLAVIGSRLVMKYHALKEPGVQQALLARFEKHGVDPARIALLPAVDSYRGHLESYGKIDIGLDAFPYHGTTTTCEALWMGVPVVTLAESPDVHASRVGISLLNAVGLTDLIAPDRDAFIRTAMTLAADRPRLIDLRQTLRPRLQASPLGDRAAFGRRFSAALRHAWRKYCTNSPSLREGAGGWASAAP